MKTLLLVVVHVLGRPRSLGLAYDECGGESTSSDLLRSLTSNGYDKFVRPTRARLASVARDEHEYAVAMSGAAPEDVVGLDARVSSMTRLNERGSPTFEASSVYVYRWTDERLAFRNISSGGCWDAVDARESFAALWAPSLVWTNLIGTARPPPPSLAREPSSAVVHWDGRVVATWSMTGEFACEFDHGRLPFDRQRCALTASFARGEARGGSRVTDVFSPFEAPQDLESRPRGVSLRFHSYRVGRKLISRLRSRRVTGSFLRQSTFVAQVPQKLK